MDAWRLIAERKIEEAMAEGAFTNLSGAGVPLCLDEDPFVDPSLRMAHRLLKNNGFAPPWIEEGKDIDRDLETLRADLRGGAGAGERFHERVHALNRRIVSFNLKAPGAVCHKPPIDAEREIARGVRP
jgi:DnaJ-like protein